MYQNRPRRWGGIPRESFQCHYDFVQNNPLSPCFIYSLNSTKDRNFPVDSHLRGDECPAMAAMTVDADNPWSRAWHGSAKALIAVGRPRTT